MAEPDDERIQAAFAAAVKGWRGALDAHRMAPPDAGFSARLAALGEALRVEARVCREAHEAGFLWPPHRPGHDSQPYELRPGTGRRGPDELWQRFDAYAVELERIGKSNSLADVAVVQDHLADVCFALAKAVAREDEQSGLLPRKRRSS
jgi:hypothetical protein